MPSAQRMGTGPDGRPIVSKVAAAGPDAGDLAAEAAVLRRAAHPGVVEVASAGPTPAGGYRLDTRLAGVRTLAGFRPPVEEAAGIVAALATTVADLHGVGVAHGAVEPDHVVLDAAGGPVLCGFGRGSRTGFDDPSVDVAGLGDVLAALVGEAAEVEPIPERRFGRRRAWTVGVAKRSLLTLADQARSDDRAVRPTARAFAGAVLATVPNARLAGGPAPPASPAHVALRWPGGVEPRRSDDTDFPRRRRADRRTGGADDEGHGDAGTPVAAAGRVRSDVLLGPTTSLVAHRGARLLGAIAGAGLVVYGVSSVLGAPALTSRADDPVDVGAPSTNTVGSVAPPGFGETLRLLECAPFDGPGVDPDGDGCLSPATIDGGVVEVDGVRYGVGEPGDILALGDWDCDGSATVVAVRPATGEVFVFEGWAAAGEELVVPATGHVAGADHAVAEDPDGDGCPDLVVVTRDGARAEVPV